ATNGRPLHKSCKRARPLRLRDMSKTCPQGCSHKLWTTLPRDTQPGFRIQTLSSLDAIRACKGRNSLAQKKNAFRAREAENGVSLVRALEGRGAGIGV